jgi:hypothetical protein
LALVLTNPIRDEHSSPSENYTDTTPPSWHRIVLIIDATRSVVQACTVELEDQTDRSVTNVVRGVASSFPEMIPVSFKQLTDFAEEAENHHLS